MSERPFRVMLTCVGGEMGPQIIGQLKNSERHNIRVIGVDANPEAIGRHFSDEFAQVPRAEADNFVDVMEELCQRLEPDLVLPGADIEALRLSRERQRIERGGRRLACSDAATIETFTSKARTYAALESLGVATPDWSEVNDIPSLRSSLDDILSRHGEAVVKPASGRGGRGVFVVRPGAKTIESYQGGREMHLSQETLLRDKLEELADTFPLIVMQRLVEPVFDLDLLGDRGSVVRIGPRRRVVSSAPNEGHIVVDAPMLIDLGTKIVEGFKLTWLYDCDVMLDASGEPMVLEINPRPSGSASFMVAAGLPLFDDLVSLAKGEPIPPVDLPVGRVVIPYKGLGLSRLPAREI